MTTELTVKFKLPDPWLVRHFDEYHRGRAKYKARVAANGSGVTIESSYIMGQYHGALALIKAGMVIVDGPPEFLEHINASIQDNVPMWVVGVVTTYVADALEASISAPLPDWMKPSSDTSSTQANSTPPQS
jgi:hypothetical protein